jgi:hypothetical protein
MRVLTVSRTFPKTHPRAGEPTYFVEKIYKSLASNGFSSLKNVALSAKYWLIVDGFKPVNESKHHTIRAGKRWKVGDMISLRVWSGAPYKTKQIEFAQVELKQVYDIYIGQFDQYSYGITINGDGYGEMDVLAANDGLSLVDFQDWFPLGKTFDGQILVWSDTIKY